MDDHVLRGMARWPNVPAVYGWLELDRRGRWLLKGERIDNPTVTDYIRRNYARDEHGRWFFQNGPQRVFVGLEYTPFVFRASRARNARLDLVSHTAVNVSALRGVYVDEHGAIVLDAEPGPGLLDDRDLEDFIGALRDAAGNAPDEDALETAISSLQRGSDVALWLEHADDRIKLAPLNSTDAPSRFGYDPHPRPPAGHPECT